MAQNPWWKYCRDEVELPSGKAGEFHYVLTNGSSMVVPVESGGTIIFVRQYRYTGRRDSLEFPCGGLKDGAAYEETARNELLEEAGFSAGRLEVVGRFNPCNGLLDEICTVFVARDLRYVGAKPDETESFELVRLAPEEIDAAILDGTIWDGMTIAAWAQASLRISSEKSRRVLRRMQSY